MRLSVFRVNDSHEMGILTDSGVYLTGISSNAFYARGHDALQDMQAVLANPPQVLNRADLTPAPIVPQPGKILCVGMNYRQHARELGQAEPTSPILFSKFNNAIAAPGEGIPITAAWQHVDYEAELGVVIGRHAWQVAEEDALNHVLGYFCANDISERELQTRTSQWLLGKTMDKFLPIGPDLVTHDEIPDPQQLAIKGWLNGELRQDSKTADMIFSVAQIIAYASRYITLEPGDIIVTGTPEGVIAGRANGTFLRPGDSYTVEIDGLGCLTNTILAFE